MAMLQAYRTWIIGTVVLSFLLTAVLSHIGRQKGWLDGDPHGIKEGSTRKVPTFGGIAIYLAFWSAYLGSTRDWLTWRQCQTLWLASTLVLVWGIIDDLLELSPLTKSIGILLAAHMVYFWSEVSFATTLFSFLDSHWADLMAYLFCILWIFSLTHAINLIDGLDGVASSVSLTSFIFVGLTSLYLSTTVDLSLVLAVTYMAAAILGFLPFNWYPAKIYLGDTGSLFIGFMYASLTVTSLKSVSFYSLILPILFYAVPVFDAGYAIIRRMLRRQPISQADRDHIHHKLLNLGLDDRWVSMVMVALTLVFSTLGLLIQYFVSFRQTLVLLLSLLVGGLFYFLYKSDKKAR